MTYTSSRTGTRIVTTLLAGLTLLTGAVAAPRAHAAPAAAGALVVGSVDVDRIVSGYTKKAAMDQQIGDMNQRLDARFKQQLAAVMLSKDELTQLGTLLGKPSPSDADRAQITALETKGTQLSQELATLQQKQNPTDADKARMAQLTQQQQAGQQALQDIATEYRKQVSDESDRLSAQLSQTVKEAIAAVAQQRGLAVVFDSKLAIYTANDITEDVLKRLNK